MKTFKIADGNGYEETLEAGTTKKEAELILANLPGWTLTTVDDGRKPDRSRKSAYGRDKNRSRHGYWPTASAVPREDVLQRVLITQTRVRMDYAPVVTYDMDAANRPVK